MICQINGALTFFVYYFNWFFLRLIITCRCGLSMWGKIIIPMYRLWLNSLYGLYGPRCPLFSKRPIDLISLSLPYSVVSLISARVPLISTRISAHCQAILLLHYYSHKYYMFGHKSLPEPVLVYCQLDTQEPYSIKFEANNNNHDDTNTKKIMYLKITSSKWQPFFPGLVVLICSCSINGWSTIPWNCNIAQGGGHSRSICSFLLYINRFTCFFTSIM